MLRDFVKGILKDYIDKVEVKKYDSYGKIFFSSDVYNNLTFLFGNEKFFEEEIKSKVAEINRILQNNTFVSCVMQYNQFRGTFQINRAAYDVVKDIVEFKKIFEEEVVPLINKVDSLKDGVEKKKEELREHRLQMAKRIRQKQEELRLAEQSKREALRQKQLETQKNISESLQDLLKQRKEQMEKDKERQKEIELIEKQNKEKELEQFKATLEKSAEKSQSEAQLRFNASLQKFLER